MFFVKILTDDLQVQAPIEPDNVFTECAGCGAEIPIDLEELLKHENADLCSTAVFCEDCSRDLRKQRGERVTLRK